MSRVAVVLSACLLAGCSWVSRPPAPVPVPEPVDAYLSAMYEDWWVPRSGYDSRIDSPNLTHVSSEEVAIVMASHLLAARLTEGPEAGIRWRKKFERLPGEIRSDMEKFIASLC